MADYATERIREVGFNAWKNDLGLSVVFDSPPEWIVKKWSLSTVDNYAHIFAMGDINRKVITDLAKDLQQAKQVQLNQVAVLPKNRHSSTKRSVALKISTD